MSGCALACLLNSGSGGYRRTSTCIVSIACSPGLLMVMSPRSYLKPSRVGASKIYDALFDVDTCRKRPVRGYSSFPQETQSTQRGQVPDAAWGGWIAERGHGLVGRGPAHRS